MRQHKAHSVRNATSVKGGSREGEECTEGGVRLAQCELEAKMATVPPPSIYADVTKYDYRSFTITAILDLAATRPTLPKLLPRMRS